MSGGAEAAVAAILERGADDADDVLRAVVEALVAEGGCAFAGLLFAEEGELLPGPQAGTPAAGERIRTPVVYEGIRVAELVTDGCPDPRLPERIAPTIAAYCLVGWDTGGVPWDEEA